jgi:hypothetical protein
MLIYLVEVFDKFSYFYEYFSIFREPYLRYLKTFSKVLNMFLNSLSDKSRLGMFVKNFEPSRYFFYVKDNFSHFLELF